MLSVLRCWSRVSQLARVQMGARKRVKRRQLYDPPTPAPQRAAQSDDVIEAEYDRSVTQMVRPNRALIRLDQALRPTTPS